jgi:pyruvate/2-oxoglutarate dehydrogenase complex dihydrolipoamide dehydrogenase (E3) component
VLKSWIPKPYISFFFADTVAAENIMGIEISIDYHSLAARVFAYPEIAFVGQLSGKRIGAFPLTTSAKAGCLGEVVRWVR